MARLNSLPDKKIDIQMTEKDKMRIAIAFQWAASPLGSAVTSLPLSKLNCTAGTAVPGSNYVELCEFSCMYGYCPPVCTCTALGFLGKPPAIVNINGYPIAGEDSSYSGLRNFDCNHGTCPSNACSTTEVPLSPPSQDLPFPPCSPPPTVTACVAGNGEDNYSGLCSFCCNLGYCPPETCTCTATGVPVTPSAVVNQSACPATGLDDSYIGLCEFACNHNYCPTGACTKVSADTVCNLRLYQRAYEIDTSVLNINSSLFLLFANSSHCI